MEPLFLTCMVIAYFFTKGRVDSAAYTNGKEPPGVAKARLRHESGGGARSNSGRPKGKGAFRLLMADRWAQACEAARQRGEHKAKRRMAWYDETAPLKDEKWREKQERRLERKNAARNQWAIGLGLLDLSEFRDRRAEDEAWKENGRREDVAIGQAHEEARDLREKEKNTQAAWGELTEDQRKLADRIKAAWSKGELIDPDFSYEAWFSLPTAVRADLLKAAEQGGLLIKATFDPEARDLAGLPIDSCDTETERPVAGSTAESASSVVTRPGTAETAASADDPVAKGDTQAQQQETLANHNSHSGGEEAKVAGCPWVPDGPSPRCGAARRIDSPYCDKHHMMSRLSKCAWSVDNPGDPECPNKREPKGPYCKEHSAVGVDAEPAAPPAAPAQNNDTNNDTNKEGTSNVYEQAVTRLIQAADKTADYRSQLATFADALDGKRWGVQVTGPIKDMDSQLGALEGDYRDLAAQMKSQGDQGAAAHEQAPWVPDDESILA